ncbi:GNA1162 family protein [Thalassobaculum sp.]|uniref:CsgG/HfaB family protein n=1 Tax=Thalassobaculum sp. TaxID=2022740 RepID=UPI0032EB9918
MRLGHRGKPVFRAAAVVLLTALLTACAGSAREGRDFVDPAVGAAASARVAVVPFENLTNHPNAGLIIAQIISTEFYERGLFQLQEETKTRKLLAELKIDPSHLTDVAAAQQAASLLEVDALVIGSVSEFGYQHGLREEPVVGLNARLVDGKTGKVLWASSHSAAGGGYLDRSSLNATAQSVVSAMVSPLAAAAGK